MKSYQKTVKQTLKNTLKLSSLLSISLLATACGGGSSSSPTPPPPVPVNVAPVADAGVDQTLSELVEITLQGAGTDADADGSIASYAWTQTAGTSVTLNNADSATPTFTAPAIVGDETLTFSLTVTDTDGASHTDSTDILVQGHLLFSGADIHLADMDINEVVVSANNILIKSPSQLVDGEPVNNILQFSHSANTSPDTLVEQSSFAANLPQYPSLLTDVTQDQQLDIVYNSSFYDPDKLSAIATINWMENFGNAVFSLPNDVDPLFTEISDTRISRMAELHAFDFDGDGLNDVITTTQGRSFTQDETINWYKNLGAGAFSAEQRLATYVMAYDIHPIGDINSDGMQDLVFRQEDGMVKLGVYNDELNLTISNVYSAGYAGDTIIHPYDYDNDGDKDILVKTSEKLVWLQNQGDGQFVETIATEVADVVLNTTTIVDLNNDGLVDVVYASNNQLIRRLNLGDGSFGEPQLVGPFVGTPTSIIAVDFDNDGDQDIIAGSKGINNGEVGQLVWYKNQQVL
ncbi:MAG: hypothetical protein ACI8WB_001571 [Phenylobacterium sp.]|jgi:hypothetical protein